MTRRRGEPALGIVPVDPPPADRGADAGIPALRTLDGVPLVCRAVAALRASGRVGQVVVVAPPALAAAVSSVLPDGVRTVVQVAALGAAGPDAPAVAVVHDVLHPLAGPGLVRSVVDALVAAGPDVVGAVAVRPVTDTLKWVDAGGVIAGTADRAAYRVVCSPQAYRPAVLRGPGVPTDPAALPAFAGRYGRLVAVPAPQEVFRVADGDDLELAEAVLASAPPAGGGQGSR